MSGTLRTLCTLRTLPLQLRTLCRQLGLQLLHSRLQRNRCLQELAIDGASQRVLQRPHSSLHLFLLRLLTLLCQQRSERLRLRCR